ncbi:hypothetical protein PIB30_104531, partial [Stylosanthes scabra]|nr:hypothetical protein [Stylosanthes scabra]
MAGFNNHRFLSVFNQNVYEEAKNKDIISETRFELKDGEYPQVQNQIALRGWKRLTSPRRNVKMLMIREFFANAARTQSELDDHEHHPLKSYVRGVKVDFSPANIRRVMKFKDQTQGAATDYNTRLATNQKLDEVLRELCIPEATWKLGTGQNPQPIQLRRKELQPLARGWLELIIHNIQPSSNRSEVTVARAILIHSILKGEDVRVEELISAKIVYMAQNLSLKGKLGFPSLIYKLCKDAKVPLREYKGTPSVEQESPITAKLMETEEGHHEDDNHEEEVENDQEGDEEMHDAEAVYHSPQPQPNMEIESGNPCLMDYEAHTEEQQQHYSEPPNSPQSQQQQPPQQHHPQSQSPQPPSQAILEIKVLQEQQQQGFKTMTELVADSQNEVLNYYEKIKEYQEYQFNQMKTIIAQQQEMIQTQNREVQVMKNRHDKMEKELSEIRQAQVNLALYKTSSRSQTEEGSKEEIQRLKKIIEEQRVALAQQSRAS